MKQGLIQPLLGTWGFAYAIDAILFEEIRPVYADTIDTILADAEDKINNNNNEYNNKNKQINVHDLCEILMMAMSI